MTNSEIGVRIKHRREQLGLTQQQIADAISVTKSTIQRHETGKIEKIKIPVIAAIARALSCNPSWIIGKSESPVLENTETRPPVVSERVAKRLAEDVEFRSLFEVLCSVDPDMLKTIRDLAEGLTAKNDQ